MSESNRRATNHVKLAFLGNPLLDITFECDKATLREYQLKPDDCIKASDHHDAFFQQLVNSPCTKFSSGGSALNSAKIAKWALGNQGNVCFIGSVGEDNFASKLHKSLQDSGVEPLLITHPEQPTGICACLLSSDGQRSLVTRHGASALFDSEKLKDKMIKECLQTVDSIYLVGYLAVHSPEVLHILADGCSHTQLLALSLSAEYICRDYVAVLMDVLPRVDIIFGNENEIKAFAESALGINNTTIEDCISSIAQLKSSTSRSRTVVVTRGHRSVVMVTGNEAPKYFTVPENVHVIDSVGCGDALAGAFLSTYMLSGDMSKAVEAGIQAAVLIAQMNGCEAPIQKLKS